MKIEELEQYLAARPQIEWAVDEAENFYFRHKQYDGEDSKIKVEPQAWAKLDEAKLDQVLTAGRNIDHITRVTGYFSKVSGWNKGKIGELADRERVMVS